MVQTYINECKLIEKKVKGLSRKENQVSLFRVVTFVLSFCFLAIGIVDHKTWANVIGLLWFALFILCIMWFLKIRERTEYYKAYEKVLQRYVNRFSEEWKKEKIDGKEYIVDLKEEDDSNRQVYRYAALDLDLFGSGSLFQYLNVASSRNGKDYLARLLTGALENVSPNETFWTELSLRQQAVEELERKKELSFELEALALLANKNDSIALDMKELEFGSKKLKYKALLLFALVSLIGLMISLLFAVIQKISFVPALVIIICQFVISQALDGILFAKTQQAFYAMNYLAAYQKFLNRMCAETYESRYLEQLLEQVGHSSKQGIRSLATIRSLLEVRHNPLVYGILCMFGYYNVFVYTAYARWLQKYANDTKEWTMAVGKMEALLSLAVIGRTKEQSTFANVGSGDIPYVSMKKMKHPLLVERYAVDNDVTLKQQLRIVTGSNMSGKTTYLRTVGINLVLAYAGAKVCASDCECNPMQLFTSMRVVDDVNHGISTFYAEVLRIKEMIEYSKQHKSMLVLIDEIFKGTNSADRIVGATAVIKNLDVPWLNGMVSTHDFELCQLEEQCDRLENYHFDEYFEEDQLKFEYKIKKGRCQTTNALHILKMAGITQE